MAFEPYTRVNFGPAKAGLKAVGYTLVKSGRAIGPRVTRGIADLGGGHYGAAVEYPSHFRGQLVWDTGGPSPQTVAFEVTPEQGAILVGTAAGVKKAAPRAAKPPPRVTPRNGFVELPAATAALDPCETPPAEPVIGTVETIPVKPRLRTVIVRDAQCPSVAWTMVDVNGCPIDLSACDVAGMVLGTLRVAPDCYNYVISCDASSPDPPSGLMVAEIDPGKLGGPGIYVAEMGVFDAAGECVAASNQFYLVVEDSLFAGAIKQGPPSIAEMRLELRDSSMLESELLDDSVSWDNSEIAVALRNVVDYWNESLPPIATYTTQNFPYRYWWKQGAKAQLFRMAAEWHRRNQIAYSAGGISYDEHGQKAQQYDQAADALWKEYRQWAQQTKMAANLNAGWGELPSDYSRASWGHYY